MAAQPPVVQIVSEPGAAADAAQDVQRGIDLTLYFFRETYNIPLTRPVRIILVGDRAAYIAVMVREFRVTQEEAERRARTTTGWTAGSTILVTVTASSSTATRVFLTAHELTHQWQIQVAVPAGPWRVYWIGEGVADAVAARVVEMGGHAPSGSYQTSWTGILRRAERRPDLSELVTQEGWFAALDRYGSSVTYRVAGLAAMYLTDRLGHGVMVTYFKTLGSTGDPAQAFFQAFSRSPEGFMEEFRSFLLNQMGRVRRAA